MSYEIIYYHEDVQNQILNLPHSLAARYVALSRRMEISGGNLGEPHTKLLANGLFELRLKGAEGIARVFYCTKIERQIVILHCFIKKSQSIPLKELGLAMKRLKEIKHENT
jgi:phage-related protein